eukprot:scaffold20149_cov61-Phaeocystis_antarctica.AAC.3
MIAVEGHSRARVVGEVHVGGAITVVTDAITVDVTNHHNHVGPAGHGDWAHAGAIVGVGQPCVAEGPPFDTEEIVAVVQRSDRHLDLPPRRSVQCTIHKQVVCTRCDEELVWRNQPCLAVAEEHRRLDRAAVSHVMQALSQPHASREARTHGPRHCRGRRLRPDHLGDHRGLQCDHRHRRVDHCHRCGDHRHRGARDRHLSVA